MDVTDLEKRKARAASETLVIAPTEGGFRVYNPANITNLYMVTGIPAAPKCNCPDFKTHESDSDWRCKHILAVLNRNEKQQSAKPVNGSVQAPEQKESDSKPSESAEKKKAKTTRNGHSQMLIKRSVSPDGFIDSVSVEFSTPIGDDADEIIVQRAKKILSLQSEIANGFLETNGNGRSKGKTHDKANGNGQAPENGHANSNGEARSPSQARTNGSDGSYSEAVPAQLLNIAGMNTRTGWTTFINVQVNGIKAKLFGDKRDLAKHITDAGFASIADHISQGMLLNLPCRVISKRSQDGKYLNIEKVFPAKPPEGNGRQGNERELA
jgi:SWIM zinc finger